MVNKRPKKSDRETGKTLAMKILSIIPVNDLDRTKSRLSSILNIDERRALTLQLLDRTIQTLNSCAGIDEVLVLTPDPRVLSFAKERRALGLKEENKGLNTGLEQATRWALDHGDEALLLLPCDLAYLEKGDVETLITLGEAPAIAARPCPGTFR
jgi:2-phospho-L-lactate guanylyltransferase